MQAKTGLSGRGIFIRLLFKSTSILLRLQKRKLGRFIWRPQLYYSEFQRGSDQIFHTDKLKSNDAQKGAQIAVFKPFNDAKRSKDERACLYGPVI